MYLLGYNIKVIGRPIGGRDEPVVDGDLDQVCWENKPNEGPCPPDAIQGRPEKKPLPATEITRPDANAGRWDKQSEDRLNRRRLAATRKKFRKDRYGKTKAVKASEMLKAMKDGEVGSNDFVKKLKDMLDFRMLGREQARSVVEGAFVVGGEGAPELIDEPDNIWYDRPAIFVYGQIVLPNGTSAGKFLRTFFPEEGTVKHEELVLDQNLRGSGIGGDFIAESEEAYLRAGFDKVEVSAGLEDGPFVWAAKGFDWKNDKNRDRFLDTLEIETMIEEQNLNDGEPLKYFDSKEEIDKILELVDTARGQDFDDEERVRPFDFTFSAVVRKILTDKKGVDKRSWDGVKRL
jgi:hypothetical protein